jgi:hypothetical protein
MRRGVKAMVMGSLLGGALGVPTLAGCGGGTATATERLWVSAMPTDPKEKITAFVTMASGSHYEGAFFQGSLFRGSHDVFRWNDAGKGRAKLQFLQDNKKIELRFETCKPRRGFDHCLAVAGGPGGTVEYQSRKRWVVRRPGKRDVAAAGLFGAALLELAEDDEELAAALDAAAEVAPAPVEDPSE